MKVHSLIALSGLLAASEAASIGQDTLLMPRKLAKQPNVLFIMSDDQDLELNSPAFTPYIQKHIRDQGIEFTNHFVTTSLCCPSRVSLWTGRQAHNTNVTDVSPPWGGYSKFVSQGFNEAWLPVWLQEAGYNTYYTGKLMNGHTTSNYNSPFPKGWNGSDFLLDPYTYSYLNSTYQRNREPPKSYAGQYTTDVISEKSLGFLNDALSSDRPFFLAVAPIAPHSNIDPSALGTGGTKGTLMTAPIPAERHKDLFPDAKVPRTANFNPKVPTGGGWVQHLPLANQTVIDYQDHFYRQRLRALQALDEMVDALITRLEESGQAENTYIVYTADNGYHIGQHRMPPGKSSGYEEDIHVPFYIRGPGIPKGKSDDTVTTHIDLAPTFFKLAGIPLREDFDGTPMPVAKGVKGIAHEHVAVEFWGKSPLEGEYGALAPGGSFTMPNNTYKSARIVGNGYSLYYSVWCNHDHELYDMLRDPYQVNNLYTNANATTPRLLGRDLSNVITRLDALLLVLKSCKGDTCIKPWDVIHPDGSVKDLRDALNTKYDQFYRAQPKVSYSACEGGYIISSEGPQNGLVYRDGLSWEAWT
ncbi:hypothetical protein Asppvi_009799 [Aspergillus pseudoviridinutans]|uniref:Arylsulfatase n=1 Tax=Aspergillus pseudoviridinutans TaxID=1517512 RepID=A0A9P3EWH9_9EURO|nr:uncharacterized protein Asppvi_009799 [Aspergillus pseudoviridinutans]GIJ90836.1 hypothetical protein Asppvi_009799 [Aspergillus pseudoviridinutans]